MYIIFYFYEEITTVKSRTFHPSLKYVPCSKIKPIPIALTKNSEMKIIVKIYSATVSTLVLQSSLSGSPPFNLKL